VIPATLLLLLGCTGGPPPTIVVVGGGPAGLAAAIEAAAGAKVVLVEARGELGGSAAMGDAVTAIPGEATIARLDAAGTNAARTRFLARLQPDVVDWLATLGVQWRPLPNHTDDGSTVQGPAGGGAALTGALITRAQQVGVEVRLNQRVLQVDRGEGITVRVQGQPPVRADAVVLATGGFGGNLERVRQKLDLGDVPLLRGAASWADGNGIDIATSLGGVEVEPTQVLFYGHGVPAPEHPDRALMLVDGSHAYTLSGDGTYLPALQSPRGDSGEALLAAGGTGWAVMDGIVAPQMDLWDADGRRFRRAMPVVRKLDLMSDDLRTLAVRMNLPYERVAAGLGATPDHSDPAHPLLEGRGFAALPLRLTTAKTLTGVRVDLDGRLVDASGAPIPGLYAAGELAGFAHPWEREHLDSTMVSGAVLTGRAAGRGACRDLGRCR